MSNTNEQTVKKKKQNDLLHDALDFKASEFKESFQEMKDCAEHAQLQSSQIWMPSFSSGINT